jgi:ATPase subunit of ABC transporter with duplicated ATPase domains
MPALQLCGAAFAYAGAEPVLSGLDLSLSRGFTAIVGENGGGKSTLLRILLGELPLSEGRVVSDIPTDERLLCRQKIDLASPELLEFGKRYDRNALRFQARLAVNHLAFENFERLSPGERMRWQIAWALERDPALLMLDEPCNHLDGQGRKTLTEALKSYRGTGILVSHDRQLLESLSAATVFLEGGRATAYPLPFAEARAEHRRRNAWHREQANAAQAVLDRTKRELAKLRDARARAERKISASSRIKGPRDSDARSIGARARAENGENRLSQKIARTNSRRAREQSVRDSIELRRPQGTSIRWQGHQHRRRVLLSYRGELCIGNKKLATVELDLRRTSRVHLHGANGAVLRLVRSTLGMPEEQILYLPQELGPADERRLRLELAAMQPEELGPIMTAASSLGLRVGPALRSPSLSPGQLRQLLIAQALGRDTAVMLLDEPTNHLDLGARERLEQALGDYPGALLVVSHDADFVANLGISERWSLADGVFERAAMSSVV